jgi:hypothetical protein
MMVYLLSAGQQLTAVPRYGGSRVGKTPSKNWHRLADALFSDDMVA